MATALTTEQIREENVKWVRERLARDCYAQVTPNLLRLVVTAVVDGNWGLDEVHPSKVTLCSYPGPGDVKITLTLWTNRGCIQSAQLHRTLPIVSTRKIADAEQWITEGAPDAAA